MSCAATEKRKLGWRIEPNFEMTLHLKDHVLLIKLKQYLEGFGFIASAKNRNIVTYIISFKKDLEILINHFNSSFATLCLVKKQQIYFYLKKY